MMKILYVVSRPLEINTSASIRNRATIMGLIENGHEVEVVTTLPDTNHMAYDESMTLNGVKITYIKLDGIQTAARIGRKWKCLEPLKKFIVRFMNLHNIYDNLKGMVAHVSEIDVSKYNLIISSSDPKSSHLFVEKAVKCGKFKGKWVQIWGDPFLADITLPNGAKKEKIFNEEKRLLTLCDKVVYVSKMTLETQKELYPEQAEKMVYIPIPYLNEIIEPIRDFKTEKQIRLAYCGDYASNVRNIVPLYEAVNGISNKVKLTLCGNSDIVLASTDRIKVLDRQSYEKVEEIEREADILIHISNLQGSQIPGKIYQYSGTNKPIVFVLDGDENVIREQFERYGRYYFVSNEKNAIIEVLEQLIIENKSYSPVTEFSKKIIASEIIDWRGAIS